MKAKRKRLLLVWRFGLCLTFQRLFEIINGWNVAVWRDLQLWGCQPAATGEMLCVWNGATRPVASSVQRNPGCWLEHSDAEGGIHGKPFDGRRHPGRRAGYAHEIGKTQNPAPDRR